MTPESATENVTDNDMLNVICVSFVFVGDGFFEKVTFTLGQIKKYTCLASPPDLRITPDLNFFYFYFCKI